MKRFRAERHWILCIRLAHNRGWVPLDEANYMTRGRAMQKLTNLLSAAPSRRDELAVCRASLIIDQRTAKQVKR